MGLFWTLDMGILTTYVGRAGDQLFNQFAINFESLNQSRGNDGSRALVSQIIKYHHLSFICIHPHDLPISMIEGIIFDYEITMTISFFLR